MNRYNCSFNISRYAVLLIFCIVCFVTNHLVCGTSVDGGLLVSEMKNRQETDQKKISNGILSKSMAHKSPNKMTEAMKTGDGDLEHGQSYPDDLSPDYDYSIRCSLSCGQCFQR